MNDVRQYMNEQKVCVVIPTYNNAATIADILRRTLAITDFVIVVIDGCTDNTRELVADFDVHVVDYAKNRGKGYALLAGFKYAINKGYEYAITLDSDGQHFPEDIPLFIEAMRQHPDALIIGERNLKQQNMPSGNTFANKFSNFWFALQTWQPLHDTQTGYRLYPLRRLTGMWAITSRYEAELELLVFAAWSGQQLLPIPVRVYYPPQGERVSHFRPTADFARISLLNTVLCLLAIVYGWPRMLFQRFKRLPLTAVATGILAISAQAVKLQEYVPALDRTPRTAVIVCPGGSYFWLDDETEGDSVARTLANNGIAAYVLRYRTAGALPFVTRSRLVFPGHHHPMPLNDVQEAIQRVRDMRRYDRVGVMGFSAGGHLALSAAVFGQGELRPDFIALCYPVVTMREPCVHKRSRRGLLGEWGKFSRTLRDGLSMERHVVADMPPVFLMNCVDDPVVDYHNSVLMDSALTANQVPHRYVQYRTGGHGFGTTWSKTTTEASHWFAEFLEWFNHLPSTLLSRTLLNNHNNSDE